MRFRLPPAPRATFLRDGAREVKDDQSDAVVFLSEYKGHGGIARYSVIAFYGKADKPAFNFYYRSEAERDEKVRRFFEGRRARNAMMASRQKARASYAHDYKVGDVFVSSWGYDQTNVDYYEVVEVPSNKTVKVRAIKAASETTGYDCGNCWPLPGEFVEKAPVLLKRVSAGGGFKTRDFGAYASKLEYSEVDGKRVYRKCYWSSYA